MKSAKQWRDGWASFIKRRHKGWSKVKGTDVAEAQLEYIRMIQKDARNGLR